MPASLGRPAAARKRRRLSPSEVERVAAGPARGAGAGVPPSFFLCINRHDQKWTKSQQTSPGPLLRQKRTTDASGFKGIHGTEAIMD
jgi:hypothetical protein